MIIDKIDNRSTGMDIPLHFLRSGFDYLQSTRHSSSIYPSPNLPSSARRNDDDGKRVEMSLGDILAERLSSSNRIHTLLDCIPTTSTPAIYSPSPSDATKPLVHKTIHEFISQFRLPVTHGSSRGRPLKQNDRVVLVLPTGPVNALALLSIAAYYTCAPVNASCTAAEVREDVKRLGARAVVTLREEEERLGLKALREEVGVEVFYVTEKENGEEVGLFDLCTMGEERNLDGGREIDSREREEMNGLDHYALVLHTSGTSGKKKVVPYTLRSLIIGSCCVVQSWDLRADDVNMNMMPLFHVGGIVRNLLAPIMSGGSAIMCSGFDPMAFWTIASQLKATWYYAAPTIHHAILGSQPSDVVPSRDLRVRMICNAAGGLLPSLARELKDRFEGAVVLPSYGMTECMPIASPPTTYQLDRPGCSGIPCGPYLSIRDPSDLERELPRGSVGAVSVRGLPMFAGYETSTDPDVPLDTSAFSSEGWFDSGDMGYMDEDGYLFITGRSKEIINKGGEVVSPFEVEEAVIIAAKDFVKASLAFSIEHDILQETIGLVLVPVPGQQRVGLTQLLDMLRGHLHPSKWPFALVYMNDLPKNSAGKPLRIKLAQRLGIGCLPDSTPIVSRHFEAEVPSSQASLTDSIPCTGVEIDPTEVEHHLLATGSLDEAAVRLRKDGSVEAFAVLKLGSNVQPSHLRAVVARSVPGYSVPDLHFVTGPLPREANSSGYDFAALTRQVVANAAEDMTPCLMAIRDIMSELLSIDKNTIAPESDFFLLGGNSLLLGKLSYHIRKKTGVSMPVATIFTNSTVRGIASIVESQEEVLEKMQYPSLSANSSDVTLISDAEARKIPKCAGNGRGQTHPLIILVQSLPFVFFHPLKAALSWSLFLLVLSYLAPMIDASFWKRIGCLVCAILVARIGTQTVAPIAAILFKWIVIGRYQPGTYRMWSVYYLRWWIVNQSLIHAGRGVFSLHPSLEILYYRLLGARIGSNVRIDPKARLGELDLISLGDGCHLDAALVRGFCVERDGMFRLAPINIGSNATINTYTQLSPGATIPDNSVYGPHSSSHEEPSPQDYAGYSRTRIVHPHWILQVFIAWPIVLIVTVVSFIPWLAALYAMFAETVVIQENLPSTLVSVIFWFAAPKRVAFHVVSRIVRRIITPLLQLVLGITIKRVLGLNQECLSEDASQLSLLRRYINSILLSQGKLKNAFSIIGTHYEIVSVVYRAMGAKIGHRVYWPGSGIYCLDPELLEIGDDVVFGSRSEFFTTDGYGTKGISVGKGAMIADRVVLLPGTRVGRRAIMGSGALGRREGHYKDGSTWIGNVRGEAVCLNKGSPDAEKNSDTTTPFGRAFYNGEASYFVYPYWLILLVNVSTAVLSAVYWSVGPIATAQILRQVYLHLHMFGNAWYQFGTLYGFVAVCFVILLNFQAITAIMWVVATKWLIIGRRKVGQYEWDKSGYCQRWQLHLVLSSIINQGYGRGGILTPLTGTVFVVWFYRALGAEVGNDCALFPGGRVGLMTEPDLVKLGNDVSIDDCSVVAHINSRGNFALNELDIGNGCAMRTGSRLLSGASMEDGSMLCEHTLLTSGEIGEADAVYVGWPASRRDDGRNTT